MKKINFTLLLISLLMACNAQSTTVRFETNVGNIDIELYDDQAPVTVQNFLNYVNDGDYDGTVIHRSVPGFVVQGGGYRYSGNNVFTTVATDSPIVLEAGLPNAEGTIAMARTSYADSATNQWFINLADNTSLNPSGSNEGYAVFGKVIRGLDIVKLIESFKVLNFSGSNLGQATSEFPLYVHIKNTPITTNNAVEIKRAFVLSDTFQINAGLSGAWFNPDTNGQGVYLEVLPSVNMLISAWFIYDLLPADAGQSNGIGATDQRWLTMEGNYTEDSVESLVYSTTGGVFDSSESVSYQQIGTVTIQFSSCNRAVMTYELTQPTISGTIPLYRQSDSNVDLCQQLAAEANQGVAP